MKRYFSQWLVSCVATKWELGGRCRSPKPVELTPLLGEMFVLPRYDSTQALFEAIGGHFTACVYCLLNIGPAVYAFRRGAAMCVGRFGHTKEMVFTCENISIPQRFVKQNGHIFCVSGHVNICPGDQCTS